jgi:hypothetical protein
MSQGYLVQDTQAMTNTIKNKESAHDYLRQRLKKMCMCADCSYGMIRLFMVS